MRHVIVRAVATLTVLTGANYILWRWEASVNWDVWWIALPLVVAETYSLIDVALFAITVWRVPAHRVPPTPPEGLRVDVFITTYDEDPELVLTTVSAAQAIRYPHRTWILDDGARTALSAEAERIGVGYVSRGEEWHGKPRHAKAGNLNNALEQTQGEFILILDADQVPTPEILDRTLGYFNDRRVAFVQTPQWFGNVPESDPLGSQAPLFYGPIQRGKDGWNAAFFCGSNGILRREALMQLGLTGYVGDIERRVRRALVAGRQAVHSARRRPGAEDPKVAALLASVDEALAEGSRRLAAGASIGDATFAVQSTVDAAVRALVAQDLELVTADAAALIAEFSAGIAAESGARHRAEARPADLAAAVERLAARDLSPLGALESVRDVLDQVSVERLHEAQPIMPLSTISVTEDMSTSMRLHAAGWRSVYHDELLAVGLAPEDLPSMLSQRMRWAQGTVQVMLQENPLTMRGLSWGQRLMYFGTMWSYLSGFAAVVYFAGPLVYLLAGVLPVQALNVDFFSHFVPFMVLNQAMFLIVANGARTWRGQQYNLALFPTWIRACTSAAANVWFGRPLDFVVTPKPREESQRENQRQRSGRHALRLVWPQGVFAAGLAIACIVGAARWILGLATDVGTVVNVGWAVFDLTLLSVLVGAARYQGFHTQTGGEEER
ncbi:glycosyltransferase [Sinomonas sp. ASV322]|uniref:glycosyltransferase n=1 Tax=Sinomonas sp. ASV322 TaxID=3041920 RepID=UPI0027DDC556|nr:glycosyltransferase [Sinomonas sp. ASV322]MDQ4501506.1 glycosyltransferase [Sinomonas sp. ASV322]